jgi:protein-export SecD/SecF family membrane protein
MKKKQGLYLALILLLAIAAGIFVYPRGFGADWRPWRLGLDLQGGSHLVYNIDLSQVDAENRTSVLDGLRDVIERRVNLFGVSEPQVYLAEEAGSHNLVVALAGVRDVSEAIREIGETPTLDFFLLPSPLNGTSTELMATGLTGQYIEGAQISFDPTTQIPLVLLDFDGEGARILGDITTNNVGAQMAVFLDDELIQTAVIQEPITDGNAQISGGFTPDEAKQLVERFNAGALPAPITLIGQNTVSPTLGQDSLRYAIFAGILGTLLIIIFMIMYYGRLGVFAAIALVIYIALTLGVFKLVPITMTLAGVAGFILTIGMAVDANILIFERVKEEIKRGVPRAAAMKEGFRHAWPSIRDSNTASIISAIILYFFTSSFVQGFALTLFIGVLISMFSAITTTRLLLEVFASDKSSIT